MKYPKRIIEVDLPIARISAHARREKSIRHGHISTLHIWWARRPLAACRAVVLASLWPDPEDLSRPEGWDAPVKPARFLDEARLRMRAWSKDQKALCGAESLKHFIEWDKKPEKLDDPVELRKALLDFIADFSNWDNSTNAAYLETSRALSQAAHEALGGEPGTRPLVVDPFAGGGSIPLEALRVGADAFASDLNPVAVLLNKVVLEYIPKYGQRLADEVRKWGQWVKEQAEKELAQYYPKDPDGATPIAYIWARTVLSEEPGRDVPVEIPLLRSLWLAKNREEKSALRWRRDRSGKVVSISARRTLPDGREISVLRPLLELFAPQSESEVEQGTARGGAALCPVWGFATPAAKVRKQLVEQTGGASNARLIAVYLSTKNGRKFRVATNEDEVLARSLRSDSRNSIRHSPPGPDTLLNPVRPFKNTRGVSAVTRIGINRVRDMYTARQALCTSKFFELSSRATIAGAQEAAVRTLLALAVSRGVHQNTSLSRWDASRCTIKGAFSKQALAVVWDFAEANPFSGASADWDGALEWIARFIEANAASGRVGTVSLAQAQSQNLPSDSVDCLFTDPPYFSAIPYADLSDIFYAWLQPALQPLFPVLFSTPAVDRTNELIVTNAKQGPNVSSKDAGFFTAGMQKALEVRRDELAPRGIGIVVYAEGSTSGWESILKAIVDAGWIVTGSWPIDTEMENRTQAQDSASLQSSVHIVCRPREDEHGRVRENEVGEWRDCLGELPKRVHDWLLRLDKEGVHGADAIFACLGPALEIFSRYSRVEKSDGAPVTLREYLEHVWAAVSKEALALLFKDADSGGLEPDARLTAMWMWTLNPAAGNGNGKSTGKVTGKVKPNEESADEEAEEDEEGASAKVAPLKGFALEYDAARKIAQGLGIHLEKHPDLVEVKGDKARLLSVAERVKFLFGKSTESDKAKRAKKRQGAKQTNMFEELQQAEAESGGRGFDVEGPKPGNTILDRVHQAMLLFGAGRGDALKRFLVDDGAGKEPAFWRLADTLVKLYPKGTDERRWAEGVVNRKKGLGL